MSECLSRRNATLHCRWLDVQTATQRRDAEGRQRTPTARLLAPLDVCYATPRSLGPDGSLGRSTGRRLFENASACRVRWTRLATARGGRASAPSRTISAAWLPV